MAIAEANSDGYGKMASSGEKPGIDTLMDLYLSMRYEEGEQEKWSDWSKPQLQRVG